MAERQREGSRERFLGREEEENKLGKKKDRLVGENHINQNYELKPTGAGRL